MLDGIIWYNPYVIKVLVAVIALLLFLVGCSQETTVQVRLSQNLLGSDARVPVSLSSGALVVGFDRRLEPKEDVRMYGTLLAYLERQIGRQFRLHVTPREGDIVDEIGAGKVDFAIVGTLSYLQARERWGARALVRGLNAAGEPTYRAAIITRPDSSIRSLADIRGRSFAFGAPNSTQGHLIPRLMLSEEGTLLSDLRTYTYARSHAETASVVASGRYDAGGIQDTLARALETKGFVRIVALSSPYPSSGIVAAPHVNDDVAEIVRRTLLDFDPMGRDAPDLYHWERSEMPLGFALARDEDYLVLGEWARSLGLLAR